MEGKKENHAKCDTSKVQSPNANNHGLEDESRPINGDPPGGESESDRCKVTEEVLGPVRFGEINGEQVSYPSNFKGMLQRLKNLETFETKENDLWLLTYGRSGTHWIYEIIWILLQGKLEENEHYKDTFFVDIVRDMKKLEELPAPKILNSHVRLRYLPLEKLMQNKIVVSIRNPKAVLASSYIFLSKMHSTNVGDSFTEFLNVADKVFPSIYGTWFEYNLECWEQLHGKKNVFFIFYEELKQDPVSVIAELSKFLGLDRDINFCEGVARITSFENMAKGVGKSEEKVKELQKHFATGKNEMFRKGIIDDWKNHFTVAQSEQFDRMYAKKMEEYPDLKDRIQFESKET